MQSWASPAKPSRTVTFCTCYTPHTTTVLLRVLCPSPSTVVSIYIKRDYSCSHSVRSFGSPGQEEEGRHVKEFFPLPIKLFLLEVARNLFDWHNESVPTHLHYWFGPMLFALVKTYPECEEKVGGN